MIRVAKICPEDGLSRQRERRGHSELCRSIAKFGVLTPITVRRSPTKRGEYLLIKGQGRTLACQMLGIKLIPAVVVDGFFDENQKVQQFLVENVARLKMKPVDRALLIARARRRGEESSSIAERFGITASTVRRLDAQINRASAAEIAALRRGDLSLTLHAQLARFIPPEERELAISIVSESGIKATELTALLVALDWPSLVKLGAEYTDSRASLLRWACDTVTNHVSGSFHDRLRWLASNFPTSLDALSLVVEEAG